VSALGDYERLKREAERERREADRAAGALRQALETMQREHGVRTVKEAERRLAELEAEREAAEAELRRKIDEVNARYGDRLR
jgi:hypothetical protein